MTTPIAYIIPDPSGLVTCSRPRQGQEPHEQDTHGWADERSDEPLCRDPKPAEIRMPMERKCEACGGLGVIEVVAASDMSIEALQAGALNEGKRCPACNGTGTQTAGIVWGIAPGEYVKVDNDWHDQKIGITKR